MDTSVLNKMINQKIESEEFSDMKKEVAQKLFSNIEVDFEDNDDMRLYFARLKDAFVSGVGYEISKILLEKLK